MAFHVVRTQGYPQQNFQNRAGTQKACPGCLPRYQRTLVISVPFSTPYPPRAAAALPFLTQALNSVCMVVGRKGSRAPGLGEVLQLGRWEVIAKPTLQLRELRPGDPKARPATRGLVGPLSLARQHTRGFPDATEKKQD